MSSESGDPSEAAAGGGETRDEELLADLFDGFLQEILEGRTPDVEAHCRERPDLGDRIEKTWALACTVAGRREPSRPMFGGYEIVRELGHGGMGTVYLARHQTLQRDVAIKVLPQSLAMSPRAKQRFLEEARALARIRHDNVVHIHRVVDHAQMLAFEMEYVDGPSLQQLTAELRRDPKPFTLEPLASAVGVEVAALGARTSIEWFVRLGIRLARALGEVHRHGLVHRDVKPANVLLRSDGTPVLADFGLALAGEPDRPGNKFAGTPVYAAPERLRGGDAPTDARSDVYSLGVTLYESLTLHPPFRGDSTAEILQRIDSGRTPPIHREAPHVSRDLATIVGKAMERDSRHRYESADDLADDLQRLLDLQPIRARPAGLVRRAAKFARRHQKALLAAAAGAALVAMIAWPIAALAAERSDRAELAAIEHHRARTRLLCQESLPAWWQAAPTQAPNGLQTIRRDERRRAIAAAVAHYERALQAAPEDPLLRAEARAVQRVHAALAEDSPPSEPAAEPATSDSATRVSATSSSARFAAGLEAFLMGERARQLRHWRDLPAELAHDPFVEACAALARAGEQGAARAYPQIFHATRAFPEATALIAAMADGAVRSGDLAMARRWFDAIPTSEDPRLDTRRRLLAADLQAASGQTEASRRSYRTLSREDPGDPRPLLRLADLELADGDLDGARRLLRSAVRRWPDLAPARRRLAILALQHRDVPAYLAQLARAVADDSGIADELLHLGGLRPRGRRPTAHAAADIASFPLRAWLGADQVSGIEHCLDVWPVLARIGRAADRRDPRPVGAMLIAVGLAALRFPDLTAELPRPLQLGLLTIPTLLGRPADELSTRLLPYRTSLGDPFRSLASPHLFVRSEPSPHARYGHQLLRIGDVDGDTLPDLCISAPPATSRDTGFLELRSSEDGSLLQTWRAESPDTMFARAVGDLGDVDDDLCDDILIGSPLATPHCAAGQPGAHRRTQRRQGAEGDTGPGTGAAGPHAQEDRALHPELLPRCELPGGVPLVPGGLLSRSPRGRVVGEGAGRGRGHQQGEPHGLLSARPGARGQGASVNASGKRARTVPPLGTRYAWLSRATRTQVSSPGAAGRETLIPASPSSSSRISTSALPLSAGSEASASE